MPKAIPIFEIIDSIFSSTFFESWQGYVHFKMVNFPESFFTFIKRIEYRRSSRNYSSGL